MKKYNPLFTFFILALITLGWTQKAKPSLDGMWKIVEVQTVKKDGSSTSSFPKESVAIFYKNNYSFCWTSQSSDAHSWQMTDSVKLDRINQMIVNAGTFEINDSILTTKALFAFNPMFVNGLAKFRYSFSGDTLVLTGLSVDSPNNIPNPLYANGSHIVNKLIRVKN